jgi:hypothetical protein
MFSRVSMTHVPIAVAIAVHPVTYKPFYGDKLMMLRLPLDLLNDEDFLGVLVRRTPTEAEEACKPIVYREVFVTRSDCLMLARVPSFTLHVIVL